MQATFALRLPLGGVDSDLVGQRGWPPIPPSVLQSAGRLRTAEGKKSCLRRWMHYAPGNTRKRVSKYRLSYCRSPYSRFFGTRELSVNLLALFAGWDTGQGMACSSFHSEHFTEALWGDVDCVMTSPFHAALQAGPDRAVGAYFGLCFPLFAASCCDLLLSLCPPED